MEECGICIIMTLQYMQTEHIMYNERTTLVFKTRHLPAIETASET